MPSCGHGMIPEKETFLIQMLASFFFLLYYYYDGGDDDVSLWRTV